MYGFWRLGVRPAPSAGAAARADGLATKVSTKAKKAAIAPRTGTVHGSRRRISERLSSTAAEVSHAASLAGWAPRSFCDHAGSFRARPSASHPSCRLRRRRRAPFRDGARPDLLLRADRRRPGSLAEDLLHPRADRADRLRL